MLLEQAMLLKQTMLLEQTMPLLTQASIPVAKALPDMTQYQANDYLERIQFTQPIAPWSLTQLQSLSLFALRLDQIHPHLNGNKAFKLAGYQQVLPEDKPWCSFGGAYSNHLLALAYWGFVRQQPTTGFVRGEDPSTLGRSLNPVLATCQTYGMQLRFLERSRYRQLTQRNHFGQGCLHQDSVYQGIVYQGDAEPIPASWRLLEDNAAWIPEGGSGLPGIVGCQTLFNGLDLDDFGGGFISAATGTMVAGVLTGQEIQKARYFQLLAVPVLQAKGWLASQVSRYIHQLQAVAHAGAVSQSGNVSSSTCEQAFAMRSLRWLHEYHFGGYAKTNSTLLTFCQQWGDATGIPVEPVYTGKLCYALLSTLIGETLKGEQNASTAKPWLLVHCGGIHSELKYAEANRLSIEQPMSQKNLAGDTYGN